jgi:hypothetical protein
LNPTSRGSSVAADVCTALLDQLELTTNGVKEVVVTKVSLDLVTDKPED